MERKRRSNLMMDFDVDEQVKISYPSEGEKEKEGVAPEAMPGPIGAVEGAAADAGSPLDDIVVSVVELPAEHVRKRSARSSRKGSSRKPAEDVVKGDRSLKISEEMYYVLVYEKARLMRSGVDVYSFGSLVQDYFFEYLRKNEKEAYSAYRTMGLIK